MGREPLRGETVAAGLAATVAAVVIEWARAVHGDRFAGHANLHIRFGPNATIHSTQNDTTRSDQPRSSEMTVKSSGFMKKWSNTLSSTSSRLKSRA